MFRDSHPLNTPASILSFARNILLYSLPPSFTFVLRGQLRKQTFSPRLAGCQLCILMQCQVVTNSECSNYRHCFQSEIAQIPRMRSPWLDRNPPERGERQSSSCVYLSVQASIHTVVCSMVYLCVC